MTPKSQDRSHLPAPARINGGLVLIGAFALPIIAVTFFGYRMFIATEVEAEVLNHSWIRTRGIETLEWASGEGPCDRLPQGLSDVRKSTEDPSQCHFRYPAWKETSRSERTGDSLVPAPSWPDEAVSNCTEIGCTREGKTFEGYKLTLRDPDGIEHECRLRQEHWERLKPGTRPRGKKSLFMERIACRSFEVQ